MPGPKSDDGTSDERKSDKSGFTVSDRRIFSDSASEPAAVAGAEAPSPGPAPGQGAKNAPDAPPAATGPTAPTGPGEAGSARELPVVDFHTFILSLGSSALLHLGELEHPDGGPARTDLPLAKHTIDIIAMLQDKTRGNLTPPEERLIESLLYDLRLRFVERSKP
jgi:hypothetical protein